MRLGILALLLASGCSFTRSLQMPNATPRQRETAYAVIGTFVVMATLAALIVDAPAEPSTTSRPSDELPPLGL